MRLQKFEIVYCSRIPKNLEFGKLYICEECEVSVHLCPCGCGEKIVTPIGEGYWLVSYNFDGTVSFLPSIGNFQNKCKSHYFITNNEVKWCV